MKCLVTYASEGIAGAGAVLAKRMVKFDAVVGKSIMKLTRKLIRLNAKKIGENFNSSFIVRNLSHNLPLEIGINPPAGVQVKIHDTCILPGKSITVEAQCTTRKFGLETHRIWIENKHNNELQMEVLLLVFVDEKRLATNLPQDTSAEVIDFGQIIIKPKKSSMEYGERDTISTNDMSDRNDSTMKPCRLELVNNTTESMTLCPKADIVMQVSYEHVIHLRTGATSIAEFHDAPQLDISKFLDRRWATHQCGPIVVLPPLSKLVMLVTCPLPIRLSMRKFEIMRSGKEINYVGSLHMEQIKPNGNEVVKIISARGQYLVLYGSVTPRQLDLGLVGYSNLWR